MENILSPSMSFCSENAPNDMICPITKEIMTDPVITRNGHTFDRAALQRSIDLNGQRCPLTRAPVNMKEVTPNLALKSRIEEWIITQKEITKSQETEFQVFVMVEGKNLVIDVKPDIDTPADLYEKLKQRSDIVSRSQINISYQGKPFDIQQGKVCLRELNVKKHGNFVVNFRCRGGFG